MLTTTNIALLIVSLAFVGFPQTSFASGVSSKDGRSHLRDVDVRIGTAGAGQTFPAIGVPFAMTFWTPETRPGEVKCIAPYYDGDRTFTGLRGSHFISGSCMRDYGSFTVMPESGDLRLLPHDRGVHFEHQNEQLSPASYSLQLPVEGISMEMSGLAHTGIMSFRWDKRGPAWLVIQNNASEVGGLTSVDFTRNELTGYNPVRRLYARSGEPAGFSGYFVLQFDHKFVSGGTWDGSSKFSGTGARPSHGGAGAATGAYLGFSLQPGEVVQVRIGTSFVSLEAARRNLAGEMPTFNSGLVKRQAEDQWSALLNRMDVTGGERQRRIFYTALYHALLHPRTFSDLDSGYPRFGGGGETMHAEGFIYYDDFSVWDTFRAVHPLFTVLDPDRDRDMVRSLIAKGEQGGYLPIFPAWNSYTSEMVGDHALAIIYDAYVKGIRGFDAEEAYRLARRNATEVPNAADSADGRGRRALGSYLKYGYIPLEDHVLDAFSPHQNEQVSRTMEYAYDDGLLGHFAADLGHKGDAALFHQRALNWRNVLDPKTGYARARHADGQWESPFTPNHLYPWLTEALASQQTFFVLHDIPGLIAAEGGPSRFASKIDQLFTDNAYDQSNEPSHHIAYLYNNAGFPEKTQQHIAKLLQTYTASADGLSGNDDAGQMSAWFVFSALGFYPVSPGTTRYSIGSPIFPSAVLHLPHGKTFRIYSASVGPDHPYIASATLNGHPLHRSWISHREIMAGGELRFQMSAVPVKH